MYKLLTSNKALSISLLAYAGSSIGTWLDFFSLGILFSFQWHTSPVLLGLLPIMYGVSALLVGQFAGVIVDRSNRLNIMLVSDFARFFITLGMYFSPSPIWILPLVALRAGVGEFNTPSQRSFIRLIVKTDELFQANNLVSLIGQTSRVLGPIAGGLIGGFMSPKVGILINSFSFLFSGLLLLAVRSIYKEEVINKFNNKGKKESFYRSWLSGWRMIVENKNLYMTILFSLIQGMAVMLVEAQLTILIRKNAPGHQELVGWIMAINTLSAFIGVYSLKKFKNIQRYGLFLGFANALIGIWLIILGTYKFGMPFSYIFIGAIFGGFGTGVYLTSIPYILTKESPEEGIGRVFGLFSAVYSLVDLIPPLVGGILISIYGPNPIYFFAGFFVLILGICGVLFRNIFWNSNVQIPPKEKETSNF